MLTLYLATHNLNKISEFFHMLLAAQLDIQICKPEVLGMKKQVLETGSTFLENVQLKARALFEYLQDSPKALKNTFCVLADDSGICVDALNGEPGVHSAYYAGLHATHTENNQKLLTALKNVPKEKRIAHFICTLVLINQIGTEYVFTAKLHGRITDTPRGFNGFGYDPLMIPDGYTKTCAELTPEEKNKISHRGKALEQLIQHLKNHYQ